MTVFVGPSIWRQINVRTASAMMAAMMDNPYAESVIWAPIWNDALIGRSRSLMCTEFLKTDADVMVIIDDDVVFEWQDFWKIVEGARETRGVYGGAYVTRSQTPHITSRSIPGTGEQVFAQTPQRRPVEYQYLATGFWACHRDVFERMLGATFADAYGTHRMEEVELGADRPFVPFFAPFVAREDDGRLHYLSEDWAFSNRARQVGATVWADLSIVLIHMGEYPYTVKDLQTLKEPGLPSTGIDVVEKMGRPPRWGDPLLDNVIEDMAAFSGDDAGDVRRFCEAATDALFKLWLSRSEKEEDWYRREDVGLHFLGDLARWHAKGAGVLPNEWMATMAGKRVLDFGAGNGQAALRLAAAGATVTAVEPNPVMREFIAYRAEKYGLDVQIMDALPPIVTFDAVIAWHVFEHLADAEGALDALLRRMRHGGELVTQSGFCDASTPMHHVRDDWEDVLASRGLVGSGEWLDSAGLPWVYRTAPVLEAVPA